MATSGSRIAKNTFALYFRMIITLVVSLYTSRIVLDALGVSDFGLYNVVGGIVVMMGFLNSATTSSTQRFLNFEKGARDDDRLNRVFGTSLLIHLLLAVVILLVAETLGLWLLNTYLNVEPGRESAANWVFQCALFSFLINTVISPYIASIVANERMVAFAYTSLLNVVSKLLAAYMLHGFGEDRLKLYAVLMLGTTLLVAVVYVFYARRSFVETRTGPTRDRALFRQMLSFSTWSIIGNVSVVVRLQGVNILLNLFFGTVVNAAVGIATQVNSSLQSFSSNFTQALNPQIVKNYAAGQMEDMHRLLFNGCRLSFYLVLLFSLPALFETEAILGLWLKTVPPFTATFVRLFLVQSLVESFASVLATAQGAHGDVKRYYLTLSTIGVMNLPISWLLLKMGYPPFSVVMVAVVLAMVIGVARLLFLRKSIKLPLRRFFREVVTRCVLVTLVALVVPLAMKLQMQPSLLASLVICVVSGLCVLVAVAAVGVSADERRTIRRLVLDRLGRR